MSVVFQLSGRECDKQSMDYVYIYNGRITVPTGTQVQIPELHDPDKNLKP